MWVVALLLIKCVSRPRSPLKKSLGEASGQERKVNTTAVKNRQNKIKNEMDVKDAVYLQYVARREM